MLSTIPLSHLTGRPSSLQMADIFPPISLLLFLFIITTSSFAQELPSFEQVLKGDGSLAFLAVGDWGRRGGHNQSLVAHQMGKVGEELDIDFTISTGDNFYDDGLTSVEDVAFEESFTRIYTARSLQKEWYTVLGNHDYRGDVLAQLNPILRELDPRWRCLRSFVVNADQIADIFFVDTTPMVENYFTHPKDHIYDWREVSPREEYRTTTLKELELGLRQSIAKWKVVVGHHPIRSVAHHGDTQELIHLLLPLLREYQVDFYINGHDHCLQHISDTGSGMQFVTSGGGSKAWRRDVNADRDGVNFFYDGQGFMSMVVTGDTAQISFYDVCGSALHRWTTSKHPLHSTI